VIKATPELKKIIEAAETELTGTLKNNLYFLDQQLDDEANAAEEIKETGGSPAPSTEVVFKSPPPPPAKTLPIKLWHGRLGHVPEEKLRKMVTAGAVLGMNFNTKEELEFCDRCHLSKSNRLPFPTSRTPENVAAEPLDTIHTDIAFWNLNSNEEIARDGSKCFSLFIDEKSKMIWIKGLKRRSEAFGEFKNLATLMKTQRGKWIKRIQSDGAGENTSNEQIKWCRERGIRMTTSNADTPQQNGLAESAVKKIKTMAATMLAHSNLGSAFWLDAVKYAANIINRIFTRSLKNATPYEVFYNQKPDISSFRTFGAQAFIHVNSKHRKSGDDRANEGTFIGFPEGKKGWKFWIKLNDGNGFPVDSRDATFNENKTPATETKVSQSRSVCNQEISDYPILDGGAGCGDQPEEAALDYKHPTGGCDDDIPALEEAPGDLTEILEEAPGDLTEMERLHKALGALYEEKHFAIGTTALANTPVANIPVTEENSMDTKNNPGPAHIPVATEEISDTEDNSIDTTNNFGTASIPVEDKNNGNTREYEAQETDAASGNEIKIRTSRRTNKGSRNTQTFAEEFHNLEETYYATTLEDAYLAGDPKSYKQAMKGAQADQWERAMDTEMNQLHDRRTWTLVDLPPGRRPVKSKWVYQTKLNANNQVEKLKARLTCCGYSQIEGIDYNEVFSPNVRFDSVRTLTALGAQLGLYPDQVDFVSAFLNPPIEEGVKIYMNQPEGYENYKSDFCHEDKKVCLLKKGLYGTKQGSRLWNKQLHEMMLEIGFAQSNFDPCVYIYKRDEKFAFVCVHVDDMLIWADENHKKEIKQLMANKYEMKDLGPAQWYLNVRFTKKMVNGKLTVALDQEQYIDKLLERFGMEDCNPSKTPMEHKTKLSKSMSPQNTKEEEEMKNVPYRPLVGGLLYLLKTRADLTYAITETSRFLDNPGQPHWLAAKRILRYLKGTKERKLTYNQTDGNIELIGYADATWGDDVDDRRSTTGYVFFLNGDAVTWKTRKQPTPALSSAEAEYMSTSAATQEAIWLRSLLSDMKSEQSQPTKLFNDNKGCVDMSKNPVNHKRTKHIDIKHHFVRHWVQEKKIELERIPTDEMVADLMTKPLGPTKFKRFAEQLLD
jgi:hypothetical protein